MNGLREGHIISHCALVYMHLGLIHTEAVAGYIPHMLIASIRTYIPYYRSNIYFHYANLASNEPLFS